MSKGLLQDKSFSFAVQIIHAYKTVTRDQKEYVLSKQLLRSGTSIGANIEEAFGAISKRDFLNKIYISYKETRETKYWIRLLHEFNYLDNQTASDLLTHVEELLRILIASIKKVKSNIEK